MSNKIVSRSENINYIPDRTIKLEILEFNSDGSCNAELNGNKFRVLGVIPGEVVLAKVIKEFPEFSIAQVSEILKSSPDRIDPPCIYYLSCTGCQFQHVKYQMQLKLKTEIVSKALSKTFNDKKIEVLNAIGSDKLYHYRNHARFTIAKKHPFRGYIGFVNQFTRKILQIDKCLLMDHKINYVLSLIQGKLQNMSQLSVRVGSNSGKILIQPKLKGIFPEIDSGQEEIEELLLGQPLRVGSPSFFQVNTLQAEKLSKLLIDQLNFDGSEVVLDAYCGVGVFSILIAPFVKEVIGVEVSDSAMDDAVFNARHFNNISFIKGYTEDIIKGLEFEPDMVILDPPRSGCRKEVLDSLLLLGPKKILMVSCDLESFLRDLTILCEKRYELKKVQPVDMFPHTKHIEVLGVIEKIDL